ncbi:enoyl-CoA hydratase-related protein [Gryllotalpicola koreensis]|uniref:Enoyl-CoA hydratase-related protein n=1 Tax=Gryllotalpicola koreensis TaxID=993086 RepID=A0ABP7ZYK0_9MICO
MSDVEVDERAGGVRVLRLNRPERLNAIGGTIAADFAEALRAADADPEVRVIVIIGAGRAFSAGADLQESADRRADGDEAEAPSHIRGVEQMRRLHAQWSGAVFAMQKPTVALVNGPAAGAGFGMALACDFRIAAESAIFVSAFARIGLSGDNGATWGLARIVGRARALEILMLSPRLSAREALELGIVRSVVPDDELETEGLAFAERLAAGPVEAFAVMKRNLEFAETAGYAATLDREAEGISVLRMVGENATAIAAFLEKREPDFRPTRTERAPRPIA